MSSSTRTMGSVKWFNNKAGYGFITCIEGDLLNKDIFVHHSAIVVGSDQFRFLVQGEFVHFDLVKVEGDEKHEFQAKSVTGINGGKLMCENQRLKQGDKQSDRKQSDRKQGDKQSDRKQGDKQSDRKFGNNKSKTA